MPTTSLATAADDSDRPDSCSSSSIVASMVTGHHLLHIDGYTHTKELAPHGKCIDSRPFRVAGHSWHITYYPNGIATGGAEHIAVFLVLDDLVAEPVKARVKFSVLSRLDGQPVLPLTRTTPLCQFSVHGRQGFDEFIMRALLDRWSAAYIIKDDRFTIRCDVFVYNQTFNDAVAVPPSDLQQHLGGLLASEEEADVTFRVAGEVFKAHRCILAARSPVLKAELLGPMKEGTAAAVVEVDDMEAEIFRALLEFVYTDTMPEMSRQEEAVICQHLLVAADRYDMERLKLICEERLRRHIDVDSAATILTLAEQHRCPGLKEACFRFLETPSALTAVAATEGFEHLARSSPSITKELIFRFIDCSVGETT